MNPKVSIVIPVYNGERYLREAIDSALSQNYSNIEVIVVNDGSIDSTSDIAKSYGDRIRYFEKENGGVSTALNLAIKHMEGEYFSWLSHDDIYYHNKIKDEIDALFRNGDLTQVVYSDFDILEMPKRHLKHSGVEKIMKSYGKNIVETGALAPALGFISGCSLLIPKHYFYKYGLFDENLRAVQDYKKWFEMFRGKRILYISKPLIQSRLHSLQTTNTYKKIDMETNYLYDMIINSMNESDLEGSGMDLYLFYGAMITRLPGGILRPFNKLAIKKLLTLDEPENVEESIIKFRKEFCHNKQIYLYCAGIRCYRLVLMMLLRGIEILGISDSLASKHGQVILGVPVVPLNEIPKDSTVIVTKGYPNDVKIYLKDNGYENVITYDDLIGDLLRIPVRCELAKKISEGDIWETLQTKL